MFFYTNIIFSSLPITGVFTQNLKQKFGNLRELSEVKLPLSNLESVATFHKLSMTSYFDSFATLFVRSN